MKKFSSLIVSTAIAGILLLCSCTNFMGGITTNENLKAQNKRAKSATINLRIQPESSLHGYFSGIVPTSCKVNDVIEG